jgi:hypothetical protein
MGRSSSTTKMRINVPVMQVFYLSRKCQRAIVQIDASSARQKQPEKLQEIVKMQRNRFSPGDV